jgi:hypothetical protein
MSDVKMDSEKIVAITVIKAHVRAWRNAVHDAVKRETELGMMDDHKITSHKEHKAREAWDKVETMQKELYTMIETAINPPELEQNEIEVSTRKVKFALCRSEVIHFFEAVALAGRHHGENIGTMEFIIDFDRASALTLSIWQDGDVDQNEQLLGIYETHLT